MKTLVTASAIIACSFNLSAALLTGFEGYTNTAQVVFRQPTFSGSTAGFLAASPNVAGVTNVFPAGNANAGLNTYYVNFAFLPTDTPWVRLTSNGTGTLPNPAIDFNAGLSFDIYTDRPLYVSVLLRETSTTAPIGGNGGTTGNIEFVGGVPNTTSSTTSKGKLVPANTWTTLQFHLNSEPITSFTGNGILESTTGKGVLEALGFATDANNSGVWNVYLDNIQVIPEPSVFALAGLAVLGVIARGRRQKA